MSPDEPALLVVEPHRVTRELYERELAAFWRVLACGDRETAVHYLDSNQVGAVVLEPVAPGEELWSLLIDIRAGAATAAVPVLICSVVDDRSRAFAWGVRAYLVKPVTPQQLAREVARWFQSQSATQATK